MRSFTKVSLTTIKIATLNKTISKNLIDYIATLMDSQTPITLDRYLQSQQVIVGNFEKFYLLLIDPQKKFQRSSSLRPFWAVKPLQTPSSFPSLQMFATIRNRHGKIAVWRVFLVRFSEINMHATDTYFNRRKHRKTIRFFVEWT